MISVFSSYALGILCILSDSNIQGTARYYEGESELMLLKIHESAKTIQLVKCSTITGANNICF